MRTRFDILSKLLGVLRNFMVAAAPFTQWVANGFDQWAGGVEKASTHTDKIRDSLNRAERDLRLVAAFFKAAFADIST